MAYKKLNSSNFTGGYKQGRRQSAVSLCLLLERLPAKGGLRWINISDKGGVVYD